MQLSLDLDLIDESHTCSSLKPPSSIWHERTAEASDAGSDLADECELETTHCFGLSLRNGRRENQDRILAFESDDRAIIGVFDGHGGSESATICQENAVEALKHFTMAEAFRALDEECRNVTSDRDGTCGVLA